MVLETRARKHWQDRHSELVAPLVRASAAPAGEHGAYLSILTPCGSLGALYGWQADISDVHSHEWYFDSAAICYWFMNQQHSVMEQQNS